MLIKQILGAVVASTALIGGVAMSAESAPEDQTATAQPATAQPIQVASTENAGTETVGEKIDDSVLTAKVKTALIASPDTKAYQINVETQEGIVRLIGAVDNAKAKDAASAVAMSVKGVKEVKNELDVKLN